MAAVTPQPPAGIASTKLCVQVKIGSIVTTGLSDKPIYSESSAANNEFLLVQEIFTDTQARTGSLCKHHIGSQAILSTYAIS
jgi:hypothetical protein